MGALVGGPGGRGKKTVCVFFFKFPGGPKAPLWDVHLPTWGGTVEVAHGKKPPASPPNRTRTNFFPRGASTDGMRKRYIGSFDLNFPKWVEGGGWGTFQTKFSEGIKRLPGQRRTCERVGHWQRIEGGMGGRGRRGGGLGRMPMRGRPRSIRFLATVVGRGGPARQGITGGGNPGGQNCLVSSVWVLAHRKTTAKVATELWDEACVKGLGDKGTRGTGGNTYQGVFPTWGSGGTFLGIRKGAH